MRSWGVACLRFIGLLLYWSGAYRAVIWWNRRVPKILLYHACEFHESDFTRDFGSNLTPVQFDRHLALLARHYNVIPLSALEREAIPERAVVITFDDGYRSVGVHAAPLLKKRSFPATVYLVTDVVDNGAMVWANELNWLLRNRGAAARSVLRDRLTRDVLDTPRRIIDRVRATMSQPEITGLLADIRQEADLDATTFYRAANLYLSWQDIAILSDQGITFGNHTATHPNLTRLEITEQVDEMSRAQGALLAKVGPVTSFAYPFGDRDARSRRAATAVGFVSILEVGGMNDRLDLHALSRTPVGGSEAELFAEIEIVSPLKATIAKWTEALRYALRPKVSAHGTSD